MNYKNSSVSVKQLPIEKFHHLIFETYNPPKIFNYIIKPDLWYDTYSTSKPRRARKAPSSMQLIWFLSSCLRRKHSIRAKCSFFLQIVKQTSNYRLCSYLFLMMATFKKSVPCKHVNVIHSIEVNQFYIDASTGSWKIPKF